MMPRRFFQCTAPLATWAALGASVECGALSTWPAVVAMRRQVAMTGLMQPATIPSALSWQHAQRSQHQHGGSVCTGWRGTALPQHRCMATSSVQDGTKALSSIWQKYVRPDAFDPHEQLLASRFNTAKEAIGGYIQPRPWAEAGLFDGVGERLGVLWHKFDAWWACFRSISGFSSSAFLADASLIFRRVSEARASHVAARLDGVKDVVVPQLFQVMKGEMYRQERFLSGGYDVHWQLVELSSAHIVDGAVEQVIPEQLLKMRPSRLSVAQFTVRFVSRQRYWVADKRGKVVDGDKNTVVTCEDYWVFERPFYSSYVIRKHAPQGARWRLVEQLDAQAVLNPSKQALEELISEGTQRTLLVVAVPLVVSALGYGLYIMVFT